jgi:hypothetical protein
MKAASSVLIGVVFNHVRPHHIVAVARVLGYVNKCLKGLCLDWPLEPDFKHPESFDLTRVLRRDEACARVERCETSGDTIAL